VIPQSVRSGPPPPFRGAAALSRSEHSEHSVYAYKVTFRARATGNVGEDIVVEKTLFDALWLFDLQTKADGPVVVKIEELSGKPVMLQEKK
jgi:hypothetical protein